jgi:hypothetical protein
VTVKTIVVELPTLEKPTRPTATFGEGVTPVVGTGGSVPASAVRPQLRISYSPHRTRVGRRSRYLLRVRARSNATGTMQYIRGVRLNFAGKRYKTDKRGRVRTFRKFKAPGKRRISASKSGYRKRTVFVRVLRKRRH